MSTVCFAASPQSWAFCVLRTSSASSLLLLRMPRANGEIGPWVRSALFGPYAPIAYLVAFAAILTLQAWLLRYPGPVWDDVAEAWSWGRRLELGYCKHPPLTAWIARLWFELFPRADWSAYLLAATTGAIGLLGVWRLASRFLDRNGRALALALLTVTPHHTVLATNFNANIILLALWPWTAFALLRSIETCAKRYAILLGLLAGLAILAKYMSALFLVGCAVAALTHPDRRRYFSSPAPYIAVAVSLIVVSPHVWWLVTHDFQTFHYAAERADFSGAKKLLKALQIGALLGGLLLPMAALFVYAVGWRRTRVVLRALRRDAHSHALRWIMILTLGCIVVTIALGVLAQYKIKLNFTIPMVFGLPVLALAAVRLHVSEEMAMRGVRGAMAYLVVMVVVSPLVALGFFATSTENLSEPSRQIALKAAELWHDHFGTPVRIVAGSELYSLGQVFYNPDRPAEFSHFDRLKSPRITRERLAKEGLLVVCPSEDAVCLANAERYATPSTIRVSEEIVPSFARYEMPARVFRIFLIPPLPSKT